MNIEDLYKVYIEHPVISTDSRNIPKGSIFFALKGEKFNGNEFALTALIKGAAFAIIDEEKFKSGVHTILVDNVLQTLQKLANYHRKKLNIPLIAITGSNGKTTTKELLYSALSTKYNVFATKGNLNNHIGVPLTLLSMENSTEIGVVEMGANHLGEIDFLCKIAEPNYGIITNIGKAHLEGFGSFEGVIKAKTELYRFIDKSNGTIFFNSDNDILLDETLKISCKTIAYGSEKKDNYCSGEIYPSDSFLRFSIKQNTSKDSSDEIIDTHLIGNYNFENALAACAISLYFQVPVETIKSGIAKYMPVNNRSQLVNISSNKLLLDYYNANPSSVEAAISNFDLIETLLNKVVILGDMFELGDQSDVEHEKILTILKTKNFDTVYLVGERFAKIKDNPFKTFENATDLKNYLGKNKIASSYILIKGSRGVKLEIVAENLLNT